MKDQFPKKSQRGLACFGGFKDLASVEIRVRQSLQEVFAVLYRKRVSVKPEEKKEEYFPINMKIVWKHFPFFRESGRVNRVLIHRRLFRILISGMGLRESEPLAIHGRQEQRLWIPSAGIRG